MPKKKKTKMEKVLIVSDVHRPYHDQKAWDLMIKVAKGLKPDHIIIIGDFADFYSVSSFSKDPSRALNLEQEIASVREGLDDLDALGAKNKIFIAGNHEDRLKRFMHDKAPELGSMLTISSLFQLERRNWTYIPYKTDYRLGKVYFTHDVGTAGRNAVWRCVETYQHPIVTGHTHRIIYAIEGNATGDSLVSAQFGWLGDAKEVDYMHRAKISKNWSLGFGVGYLEPTSGYLYLTPVPIIKYTCVLAGVYYK